MPAIVVTILQLIIQYGIPGAIQIISLVNKPTITQADLDELAKIKPPESYFTLPTVNVKVGG